MPDAQTLATSYLSPSTDSLWRWSTDGDALTWSDGSTIAFRQEVEHVIARLAPQGLPPFGAVAMLLAACRPGWDQSAGRGAFLRYANVFSQWRTGAQSSATTAPLHASQLVFQRVSKGIQQVVEGLDGVSRFAPEVRQTKEAKATLAEAVFECAKNRRLTPDESALVVKALEDGVNPERLTLRFSSSEALREFADDADALREGLPRLSEQSLALRQRTGLDELPKAPEDLDLAPAERVRRLLAELRRDKELAGLARLAQDLMAAVHVPRTLRQQEELPLGGVSDLSNRGPLDRLLVSELAHDDLTLAVRVAVNEALYLRRESPPRQPPNRRAILLDAGIRMWGIPRVFGVAVALALAATSDPRAELLIFRATLGGVEPVDLTTRQGLTACLEALEPTSQPGSSLAAFLAAAEQPAGRLGADDSQAVETDAILVTHPDALADAEFSTAIRQLDNPPLFAATVDRDGSFELLALTAAGRKPVREAALSLDTILEPDRPVRPEKPEGVRTGSRLIVKDLDPDLPSIFAVDPFPLRLPHVADPKLARASRHHGLVALTKDGRLLHWGSQFQAARQLTALLPAGRPRGIWIDDAADRAYVLFDQTKGARVRLVTADLSTGVATAVPLQPHAVGPMTACIRGGVLFLVLRQKGREQTYDIEAYDLNSGAPTGATRGCCPYEHVRDRFFRDRTGRWDVLSHDGQRPVLTEVTFPGHRVPHLDILNLFDRAGFDGPWAILSDGHVIEGTGKVYERRFIQSPVKWKFIGVSADGDRLALGGLQNYLLDFLADDGPKAVRGDIAEAILAPQIHWSTRSPAKVRTDFRHAYIGDGGLLSLVTPNSELFQIDVNSSGELILKEMGRVMAIRNPVEFKSVPPPRGMRIELSAATWPCGSRAYLDSRGMLHLRSANRSVPEVSLILTNEKLAAWSPAGNTVYGPKQFVDPHQVKGTAAMIPASIRQFITNLKLA